jgi:oxygen-independent coproporphyrinogen-3 oxidase
LLRGHDTTPARIDDLFRAAKSEFGDFFEVTADGAAIPPAGRPLTRMIARMFDEYDHAKAQHSAAV